MYTLILKSILYITQFTSLLKTWDENYPVVDFFYETWLIKGSEFSFAIYGMKF